MRILNKFSVKLILILILFLAGVSLCKANTSCNPDATEDSMGSRSANAVSSNSGAGGHVNSQDVAVGCSPREAVFFNPDLMAFVFEYL